MRFTYTAQDKKGVEVSGDIEAADEKEAASLLVRQGLLPLRLTPIATQTVQASKRFLGSLLSGSIDTFDEVVITRHLGTILSTGTDLLSGLDIIAEDAIKPIVKDIAMDARSRISTGQTLSQALGAWGSQFNPVLLSLVRAGELAGNMAEVLTSYSKELRKEYAFNRKVKGAMVYPAILISALVVMMLIIMTFVIPKLKDLFASTNVTPPLYTRIIFGASDIWLGNYLLIIILFFALGIGGWLAMKNSTARRKAISLIYYLPYLRTIHKNYSLLRLCKTLSHLIKAGIPLERALTITGGAIGGAYEPILKLIAEKNLARGISLAQSMRQYRKSFSSILISVIATGEKSGRIDSSLDQMGEFYEEEVLYALERFLVIIEPVLIVIVGVIIGLVAGSLIAPIYRFIGRF
jgi:type IV pilus assembly protein PilC